MFVAFLLISQVFLFVNAEFPTTQLFGVKDIFEKLLPTQDFVFEEIEKLLNLDDDVFDFEETLAEFDESKAETFVDNTNDPKESFPEVKIDEFGTIRGKVVTSFFEREVYAFQSIPYAMPPVGDRRFKMPETYSSRWTEDDSTYDGTFIRAKCPQSSMAVSIVGGREDCLHLSIYTPEVNGNYPVMFFIHGGAYVSGEASLYMPTKLMDRDVVVVVIQYRLGSLGFLASGTPDAPGNMGLMDQVMALRWVQNYISYFGGNPEEVTVCGQSAGAASASWMMFTPQTNADNNPNGALLKRVISASGSALEAWTLDSDPEGSFIKMATNVECYDETATTEEIVACMRDLDYSVIVDGANKMIDDDMHVGGLGFLGNCPVIQKDLVADYPDLVVIPDHPLNLIKKGQYLDVDLMTGSVRDEGVLVLALLYGYFISYYDLMYNDTFLSQILIPGIVRAFGIQDITGSVSNSLRLAFLRDAEMGNWDSMNGGLIDMLGMMFLKSGAWQLTEALKLKNPAANVYFYSFEFESDDSLYDWYFISSPNLPVQRGITHADDLLYLFSLPSLMDERQKVTVRRLTKFWSNFATYGNPTPANVSDPNDEWEGDVDEWLPYNLNDINFMLMQDQFSLQSDFVSRWNYNSIQPANETTI